MESPVDLWRTALRPLQIPPPMARKTSFAFHGLSMKFGIWVNQLPGIATTTNASKSEDIISLGTCVVIAHHFQSYGRKSHRSMPNRVTIIIEKSASITKNTIQIINQTPNKLSSVPTKSEKTSEDWIMLYSLPFWYGATTRLALIYFAIHMKFVFHLEWIGFYFASSQAMRLIMIASVVGILAPKCIHIIGSLGGLAGYIVFLVSSGKPLKPFVIATVLLVSSAESLFFMQTYLKKHFKTNLSALEKKLKLHYMYNSVTLGEAFAYGVGGVQHNVYGMEVVVIRGIIFAAVEFFCIVWSITQRTAETVPKENQV